MPDGAQDLARLEVGDELCVEDSLRVDDERAGGIGEVALKELAARESGRPRPGEDGEAADDEVAIEGLLCGDPAQRRELARREGRHRHLPGRAAVQLRGILGQGPHHPDVAADTDDQNALVLEHLVPGRLEVGREAGVMLHEVRQLVEDDDQRLAAVRLRRCQLQRRRPGGERRPPLDRCGGR